MPGIKPYQSLAVANTHCIQYLTESQTNALVSAFQQWYDKSPTETKRKIHGRYWLTFLVLRFTGARLGEVLLVDER